MWKKFDENIKNLVVCQLETKRKEDKDMSIQIMNWSGHIRFRCKCGLARSSKLQNDQTCMKETKSNSVCQQEEMEQINVVGSWRTGSKGGSGKTMKKTKSRLSGLWSWIQACGGWRYELYKQIRWRHRCRIDHNWLRRHWISGALDKELTREGWLKLYDYLSKKHEHNLKFH